VTKNTPNIFIAARLMAKKPKTLEELKTKLSTLDNAAIIAPTMITEEIALVTDIRGVCKEGVTLQTT
tara:strand:- start:98 stop:298 length:201 start_codon:yes stop_codon:yes gene_type:complete